MAKAISYHCNEETLVAALEKSIGILIDPSIAHRVCGFRIVKGSRHQNNGHTVSFFTEVPEDIGLVARTWNFESVSFDGPYSLNLFLKFKSQYFLNEVPDINGFMLEWARALGAWVKEQNITISQALLLHPVHSVECIKDDGDVVKMRMKFALKEKINATLWNLRIVS